MAPSCCSLCHEMQSQSAFAYHFTNGRAPRSALAERPATIGTCPLLALSETPRLDSILLYKPCTMIRLTRLCTRRWPKMATSPILATRLTVATDAPFTAPFIYCIMHSRHRDALDAAPLYTQRRRVAYKGRGGRSQHPAADISRALPSLYIPARGGCTHGLV